MNKKILIAALFLVLFMVSCKSNITGSVVVDPSPAGPDGFVEEAIKVPTIPQIPQGPEMFPVSGFEEKPKKYGYIIQFKEDPIAVKQAELQEKGFSATAAKESLDEQRAEIEETQQKAIADIQKILSGGGYIISSEEDLKIRKIFTVFNAIAINVPDESIEEIKKLPYVKAVYEDSIVYGALMNSVPLINADDVWNLTDAYNRNITGQNVTVAIVDSGMDYTHPDLGNCTNTTFLAGNCSKVIGGFDLVNNDSDPRDDNGHGTHTGSTAGGNGILKGVAPDAKLLAYKCLNQNNWGTWADCIAAIDRAANPNQDNDTSDHADVIGVILDGGGNPDDAPSQAMDNAALIGAIMVVAEGNGGPNYQTTGSPGVARKAITVGGSDKQDNLYYYSSRGQTSVGTIKPDVVAPGVSICAARYGSIMGNGLCVDNLHVYMTGTSMSTPHVIGLAALLKQKYPNWTTIEQKMALRNTAVDIGYDHRTQGWGRVDALAALQLNLTPCIAEFNTYNFTGAVNGTFNIKGTATCAANFSNYTVYYGVGVEPTTWTLINSSTSSVNNGVLAGWNSSAVQDDQYTLKLLVVDNGNRVSEDRIIVNTINNRSFCFSCADCDLKVDFAGANVTLANNINSTGYCIWVQADNVALDCAGYTLTGSRSSDGIYIDHSNVAIKNCIITNYSEGIYISGAVNNNLTNNSMYNNAGLNFNIWGYNPYQGNHSVDTSNRVENKPLYYYFAQQNAIIENLTTGHISCVWCTNVTIRNNNLGGGGDEIRLRWTNNSRIINNKITNTFRGIHLDGANYHNQIINNMVQNSTSDAFNIYLSNDNQFINNTLLNGKWMGIISYSSDNNEYAGNTVIGQPWHGILIYDSDNNNLTNNYVINNTLISWGGAGILLEYGRNNNIINNTIFNNQNKGLGFVVAGGSWPSDNNTIWYNNISSNSVGINLESSSSVSSVNNNISYNNIYGNTWDLKNVQTANITAENNWWGTTFCPNINLKIYDYHDSNTLGVVDYNPILNSGWPGGSSANCTIPPLACGQAITGNINLSQNLTGNGTCLTLGANNVVLDCMGYSLTGNGSGYGIEANGKTGLTIKNCKIFNFSDGIYFNNVQQSVLDNNTLSNNSNGISIGSSNYNNLTNNNILYNQKGIESQSWTGGNLNNNISHNNILNNTLYNLYVGHLGNIIAENNWWGNWRRCPDIAAKVYDYSDNQYVGIVDFNPVLNDSWPMGSPVNCDEAPRVTLISPLDNSGDIDGNVTFFYNVTDDGNITNCSLMINSAVNQSIYSVVQNATLNFTLNDLPINGYSWGIDCTDSVNNTATTQNSLTVIKATKFGGRTTNMAQTDVSNMLNFVLEIPGKGMINSSQVSLIGGADLDSYVNISDNWIEINSSVLWQLSGTAILTLYNLSFNSPKILRNGADCPASICQIISYVNGTLTFSVTGFTSYSAAEYVAPTPPAPSGGGGRRDQCNDKRDNDNDGLIDYPDDPGCLSRYDDNEGDEIVCIQSWVCNEWNLCVDGKQNRTCEDTNKCEERLAGKEVGRIVTINKPPEIKECIVERPVEVKVVECITDEDCAEDFECQENKCVEKVIEVRKPEAIGKGVWPWVLFGLGILVILPIGFVIILKLSQMFLISRFDKSLSKSYDLIKTKNIEELKENYGRLIGLYKKLPTEKQSEVYGKIMGLYKKIKKSV